MLSSSPIGLRSRQSLNYAAIGDELGTAAAGIICDLRRGEPLTALAAVAAAALAAAGGDDDDDEPPRRVISLADVLRDIKHQLGMQERVG